MMEADKIENDLVFRLLTLLKTLKIEDGCFVRKDPFGSSIYVKNAKCTIYNLDDFSKRRLPSDKVLAIQYPEWLDDFAMYSTWYLTPRDTTALITLKGRQFMFIFSTDSVFNEEEFNEMLQYDKAWNALMVTELSELPLAISKRKIRGLKVGASRNQLFKLKRF
ncbi:MULTISPECIES: hypothetical protein [Vibrio harveyi group]|uniref:hypothetical protein n=1 Tax=Vibrio harveyi group TaxID=717610 RepID=UPI0015F615E4|nr:hypothetical protein [Vibrio alginolyticus]HDM8060802.1 hypothetical protein [Vibrio harveyi]